MHPVPPRLRLLRFLPILLASVGVPGAQAGAAPRHAVLQPFEPARGNGTPIVLVRFSDTVTGRFMVDTGATDCVMTDAFAKRLGFKQELSGRFIVGMLQGAASPPTFVQVPALDIGSLRITGSAFLVVGPRRLPALEGQPVDGILGGTLLSRFALLLDYPRHNLVWITPGSLDDKAVAALGFGPENAVPLTQEKMLSGLKVNHYSARVELRAGDLTRASDMLIDTGSPFSSLSYDTAARLKLMPLRRQEFALIFMGAQSGDIARVPALKLGHVSIPDVLVLCPAHKDVLLPPLIGENVLSGAFSLFDFGPHRFYFKPVLPWLTAGPLPPVDRGSVDWGRLRRAPELPTVADVLAVGLTPEAFESRRGRVARLRARLTGGLADAARYFQIGALLRADKDQAGAQAALGKGIGLLKGDAEAHPEEALRAAPWAMALLAAGREDEALPILQKATQGAPASAVLWCDLGLAQETQAARLVLGAGMRVLPGAPDADAPDSDTGLPDLDAFPDEAPAKLPPAQAEQAQAERREARDSCDRAALLDPKDPEAYRARAAFGVLDFRLDALLRAQGVKDKIFSPEALLAGALTDYQNYMRLKPDDPDALRRAAVIDLVLPVFHDRGWLKSHGRGAGRTLPAGALMTASAAQARLAVLGESADKAIAAPALEALGALQSLQDDDGAETSWRRALALDPARPGPLRGLAARLLAAGRLDDLRALLEAQLSVASSAPARAVPVRLLLAATLQALDLPDAAEAQTRLALRAAPDSPAPGLLLAGLLLRRGDAPAPLAEAAQCLTTAQAAGDPPVEGGQSAVQTMQAVLLALTGDATEARRKLLEIVRTQPTCTQAREALAALTPMTTVAP